MTQSLEVLPGCDLWAIKASLGMCVLEKSRGTGMGQLGRAGDPEVEGGGIVQSLLVQGREREPEPHSPGSALCGSQKPPPPLELRPAQTLKLGR